MIIKGIDVTRHNLSSIALPILRNVQATLAHYVGQKWGDVTEEKILMKLISVEIKRRVKVENINLAAKKKSEWIIDNWDLIDRQEEPLKPMKKADY